jgi:hypothetical protein
LHSRVRKAVTELLATPAARKRAEREIAETRRFEQLVRDLLAVNAKICQDCSVSQEQDDRSLRKNGPPIRATVSANSPRPTQERPIRSGSPGDGDLLCIKPGDDGVTGLLPWPVPDEEQRTIPYACGRTALYEGTPFRPILTIVGWAGIQRPYYLCAACKTGQFAVDLRLDIDKTVFSRSADDGCGVQRDGVCPRAGPHPVATGSEVTAKAVKRIAESIGKDVEARQQTDIRRAKQLHLPIIAGFPIPLSVRTDGQYTNLRGEVGNRSGAAPPRRRQRPDVSRRAGEAGTANGRQGAYKSNLKAFYE